MAEDDICKGCKFLPTKPEAVPEEIIEYIAVALEFDEISRIGGKFDYPSSLSPVEWASLRGLTRGRDHAESLRQERERAEQKRQKAKVKSKK